MRAFKRLPKNRGFTLVELMIVVAIIGILAALAIYGVKKFLSTAKSAEAKNNIGAITRASVAAYERESTANEILADGVASTQTVHQLCKTSTAVPTAAVANKKYQPNTDPVNGDWVKGGDSVTGWPCLRFSVSEPIAYQYGYGQGAAPAGMAPGYAYTDGKGDAAGFEVVAMGDTDGNGVFAEFVRGGTVRNGQVVLSTELYIKNETE
jgi:type IV pilus assembly protein PilA